MSEKFLSPEELSKRLVSFKDMWYGIPQKSEALSNFRSGFDAGFKEAIAEISSDVEACKAELNELEVQLKHRFPELRSDISEMSKKILNLVELFDEDVKEDRGDIDTSVELRKKLNALNKDLKKATARYKSFEKESADVATRYFDMKSDYSQERQKIENASKDKVDKVQKKFVEKAMPIVEGHDIFVGPQKVDLDGLFGMLVETPKIVGRIKLVSRKKGGFFGKSAKEDNKARSSVLKYVAGEILDELAPINKEKTQLLLKLDSEYSELKDLEKECAKNEAKLKELARPRDKISEQIARIKEDKAFRLSGQDGVLEVRGNYLAKFNNAHEVMKEYLEVTGKALEGYEPLEPDVEKRELRAKKKELSETIKALEKKVAEAERELKNKSEEFEKAKEGLESDIQKLENEKTNLQARLDETADKLSATGKERDDYRQKSEELTSAKVSLESDLKKLEGKNTDLQKRLDETADKLTISEEKREEYKRRTREMAKELEVFRKEMATQFKDLESNIEARVEEIRGLEKGKVKGGNE
ncbi:MAG: hypothetical protein ACE5PM_03855 [Candidatus Hydrothermarchaeales archaeon]